jgi:hypothetical protein
MNPVKTNIVEQPEDYPWSSARAQLSYAPIQTRLYIAAKALTQRKTSR